MYGRTVGIIMHAAGKYRIKNRGYEYQDTAGRIFLMENCGCGRNPPPHFA